ncbi:hypothetical protein GCM10018785_23110 [Streptomyces longispororuber]|uniref:Uncharacterized protein n=1 Tax=Streptomyces longispororuber TaxID=68230 RepID=A0A918ZI27_9ACTN|nr:hypothetical protein [Streptomyces longispororuber]GHE52936.1 hypothetical protein GCM10018785_23110 [Streptomyces longispororuber]
MAGDWEVDVQLLLEVADDAWARLLEGMVDALAEEPRYEIVPTATSNSPTGAVFSVGATLQVTAGTPGEAADTAVAVTRRALRSAGGPADRGVAEITIRRGDVDPRLSGL